MRTFTCPIRGHDHNLTPVVKHIQANTGAVAYTYECPGGAYRWFVLPHHTSPTLRFARPRWGWRKTARYGEVFLTPTKEPTQCQDLSAVPAVSK